MKKLLAISVLASLAGCGVLPSLDYSGGQGPPATPVFFQPFSAALDADALKTIQGAAQAANAAPDDRVIVIGGADNTGSPQVNKYLSKARAQMVADTLEADGVAPGRIRIHGAGTVPNRAAPGQPAQSARRALIELRS